MLTERSDGVGAGVGVRVSTGGVGVRGHGGGVFDSGGGVFDSGGGVFDSGSGVVDEGSGSQVASAGVGVAVTESRQELLIGFLVGNFFGKSHSANGQHNNELFQNSTF